MCGDVHESGGSRPFEVVVALGSSEPMAAEAFRLAAEQLRGHGAAITRTSSLYRTTAVGPESSGFTNAALVLHWGASLPDLLDTCQSIERAAGRSQDGVRWSGRPLDLDLIAAIDADGGPVFLATDRLTLPHPLAFGRRFVLDPLVEIRPATRLRDDLSASAWLERWRRRPLTVSGLPPTSRWRTDERIDPVTQSGSLDLDALNELVAARVPLPLDDALDATVQSVVDEPIRQSGVGWNGRTD